VGPYRIGSPIGAGGMGRVYKAHDSRLGRDVAIKVLREDVAGHPSRRSRLEIEARAVAALNHPHICTLHDVGPNYLVMEYIEGESLAAPLDGDKACEFEPPLRIHQRQSVFLDRGTAQRFPCVILGAEIAPVNGCTRGVVRTLATYDMFGQSLSNTGSPEMYFSAITASA